MMLSWHRSNLRRSPLEVKAEAAAAEDDEEEEAVLRLFKKGLTLISHSTLSVDERRRMPWKKFSESSTAQMAEDVELIAERRTDGVKGLEGCDCD